jgi:hypothetical protein
MDDKAILKRYGEYNPIGKGFSFIDNNATVLAVAHVDTVFPTENKMTTLSLHNDEMIISPRLDDRLGVYTLLYALPELGINVDVLLTNGEECGQSSANDFTTTKSYNWMFSFDRRGILPVTYQYGHKDLDDKIKSAGYSSTSTGSYSDIADLDFLKVDGINFGVGYENEHTLHCHALLSDWQLCVLRFAAFYWMYYEEKMPYDATTRPVTYGSYSGRDSQYYNGYIDSKGIWHYFNDNKTTKPKTTSALTTTVNKRNVKVTPLTLSSAETSNFNEDDFQDEIFDTQSIRRNLLRKETCVYCEGQFDFSKGEIHLDTTYQEYICDGCRDYLMLNELLPDEDSGLFSESQKSHFRDNGMLIG